MHYLGVGGSSNLWTCPNKMYPLHIHQRCAAIVLNNRKCIESFCKVEVMFGSAVVQQAINFVMWKHCTRAIARDDSIDTELEVTIYINYINKQQSIQRTATPLHCNKMHWLLWLAVAQSHSFNPVLANKDYLTLVITCTREIWIWSVESPSYFPSAIYQVECI